MVSANTGFRMRIALTLLVLAFAARTVHAQAPGMTMSFDRPPPLPVLSAEDRQILEDGEVSDGQWIGGVAASIGLGFGIGQAIEGRWRDTGWIFTLGESASFVTMIVSLSAAIGECWDCSAAETHRQDQAADVFFGSLIVFAGLHIWEIGDAAIAPAEHNERYHAMRARHPEMYSVMPYVVPSRSGSGGGFAGVSLRF
jgi:hypothetical protein